MEKTCKWYDHIHKSYLQCEKPIFKLEFFSQEISSNRSFILITELFIHKSEFYQVKEKKAQISHSN